MKNSKRFISMALCLALVFSMLACLGTVTASAAGTEAAGKRELDWEGVWWYSDTKTTVPYSSGSGTVDDPYIVTTAAQLRLLAKGDLNGGGKYYKLGNDIVLNDTSCEDWYLKDGLTNWIKGTDDTNGTFSPTLNRREMGGDLFRDNFDGDGHTVFGLYINYEGTGKIEGRDDLAYWGLFPAVYGATIKNLKLKDVYIKSNVSGYVQTSPAHHGYGALIGYSYSSGATVSGVEIENVKFDIQRPNQLGNTPYKVATAGIIGVSGGPITITDCIVRNITVKAYNNYFSRNMNGYAGSILGFVTGDAGCKHTLNNIISVGKMNPISSGTKNTAVVTNQGASTDPFPIPLRSGSTATNVYAIGAEEIRADSGIVNAADEATFISTYLDTFYSNIGTSTNWAAKDDTKIPSLKFFPYVEDSKIPASGVIEDLPLGKVTRMLYCDFDNYLIDTNKTNTADNWSIITDSENNYLKGDFTEINLIANNFGFMIPDNSVQYYGWATIGPMVPGGIYKLDFKAKADEEAVMDFAIYNGYSYAINNRADHSVAGGYDAFGRRTVELTTEWQEFSICFTAEDYSYSGGTGKPYFFIQANDTIWGNSVYFDDMTLTECEGLSFAESANHYYEPTVGNIGDDITLIEEPTLEGYTFDGWYVDSERLVPLGADAKIGDYTVVYSKWTEGSEPGECEHTGGTEIRDAVAATCTEDGYTGDTYCLDCGEKIADGEAIAATGHSVGEWLSDETDHWHVCGTCQEQVDKAAHTASDWIVDAEATAEAAGHQHKECTVCGKVLEEEDIPKLTTHTPGDVNGDGELNNKDLTRLFQYLSDWDVEVNEAALDVNGDGTVNNKDLTRLFQYLSDWDVEIF